MKADSEELTVHDYVYDCTSTITTTIKVTTTDTVTITITIIVHERDYISFSIRVLVHYISGPSSTPVI